MHKVKVKDVDELRQHIQTVGLWDELDQRITDKVIKQWCTLLRACVEAKLVTLSTNFKDWFRMIVSINVSHFVKICQVLTILQQLICRGVANFGTRCSLKRVLKKIAF